MLLRASRLFALLAVGLVAATAPAQPLDDDLVRVETAFGEADADAVLEAAGARVEIVLFGQGTVYRRAQARHVLRDFFRRHPPERVAFAERSSSDDGRMAMGRYWTQRGGTPLTLRLTHRAVDDRWELVSIRVEQPSIIRTSGR